MSRETSVPSTGLSPRVRGNQDLLDVLARWNGSIPACAGEPNCVTLALA